MKVDHLKAQDDDLLEVDQQLLESELRHLLKQDAQYDKQFYRGLQQAHHSDFGERLIFYFLDTVTKQPLKIHEYHFLPVK
jgi:hypothetical protein